MLIYTEEKKFTQEQVQQLFLSVNWISGNYPKRLYKALMNSSTVLTVWDDDKLVGLARVLDDSEILAQIHYVLVHPDYQGKGIAGKMIEYIKEKYKDFLYIEGMPEDKNNVPFYEKHGFSVMENGAAIQICNYENTQQRLLEDINTITEEYTIAMRLMNDIDSETTIDSYGKGAWYTDII